MLTVLGPNFERLAGEQVTTLEPSLVSSQEFAPEAEGVKALVASRTYPWEGNCPEI